jgi:hypothetical protein
MTERENASEPGRGDALRTITEGERGRRQPAPFDAAPELVETATPTAPSYRSRDGTSVPTASVGRVRSSA